MNIRPLLFGTLVSICVSFVWAQDNGLGQPAPAPASASVENKANGKDPTPLAKSLRGRWSNAGSGHSDLIEVEVLEMNTPTEGKAQVAFWPYCRKSETPVRYDRELNAWSFTAANCRSATDTIQMYARPVDGKRRMDGWYGGRGESSGRSVYLEWKQ